MIHFYFHRTLFLASMISWMMHLIYHQYTPTSPNALLATDMTRMNSTWTMLNLLRDFTSSLQFKYWFHRNFKLYCAFRLGKPEKIVFKEKRILSIKQASLLFLLQFSLPFEETVKHQSKKNCKTTKSLSGSFSSTVNYRFGLDSNGLPLRDDLILKTFDEAANFSLYVQQLSWWQKFKGIKGNPVQVNIFLS